MNYERVCYFDDVVPFVLDSGIETELSVQGEYRVRFSVDVDYDTPYGVDYEVINADIDDCRIVCVFSDNDDDQEHYSLNDNEYKRLSKDFYNICEKDFDRHDVYALID